jgi:hypothetical protein
MELINNDIDKEIHDAKIQLMKIFSREGIVQIKNEDTNNDFFFIMKCIYNQIAFDASPNHFGYNYEQYIQSPIILSYNHEIKFIFDMTENMTQEKEEIYRDLRNQYGVTTFEIDPNFKTGVRKLKGNISIPSITVKREIM